ncbi:hypothetical protein IHQ11_08520 [Priestia megaterium]|nr:hypothetical protein [Priestia megaterium]
MMESNILKWIPVPYFQLNQEGEILHFSSQAHSYFSSVSSLWSIIHKDDRKQAMWMLSQHSSPNPIIRHLRLRTTDNTFVNFKCTIHWKNGVGHLVCTEKKNVKDPLDVVLSAQSYLENSDKRLKESDKVLNNSADLLFNRLKR